QLMTMDTVTMIGGAIQNHSPVKLSELTPVAGPVSEGDIGPASAPDIGPVSPSDIGPASESDIGPASGVGGALIR
ncbi:Bug family tripartite tricarboxylate transporter substrate binding protein, partial [Streptomyces sp. NPDC003442]